MSLSTLLAALLVPALAGADPVPLPANGDASDSYLITSQSCPAAGSCVLGGYYTDSSGYLEPLLVDQTAGVWSATGMNLSSLNPAASTDPSATVANVACASAGNCTAVGWYHSTDDDLYGAMAATEADGVWGAAVTLTIPAGTEVSVDDAYAPVVSCSSPGNCVALVTYKQGSSGGTPPDGGSEGPDMTELLTETDGTWTGELAQDPDGGKHVFTAAAPSCTSSGSCTAALFYYDAGGVERMMTETATGGVWAGPVSLSLGSLLTPDTNTFAEPESTSCPSADDCTVVGAYYDDGTNQSYGFAASESGGTWEPATALTLPANASTTVDTEGGIQDDLYVTSVWCASIGNCTAFGTYDATSDTDAEPMTATETNGTWGAATELGLPAGAQPDPEMSGGTQLACSSFGNCIAVGPYEGTGPASDAAIFTETGGAWTVTAEPVSGQTFTAPGVACAADGYCTLVGSYDLAGDVTAAALWSAPGPAGGVSATAGVNSAVISWQAPTAYSGFAPTAYTVTATDTTDAARGGQVATTTGSTPGATLTGLTAGDSYTFTVTATSLLGIGLSATSNAVTVNAAAPAAAPTPTPTRAQIVATLKKILMPTGKAGRRRAIIKAGGYTFKYRALEAGRLVIDWYYGYTTGKGKHKKKHRTLVASANVKIAKAGTINVKVKITKAGRKLLEEHRKLKLSASAAFTPTGATAIRETKTFTLH